MKEESDYIRDIAEIRAIMERTTKFLSLSGWAGVLAGIYALAGTYLAYHHFAFHPDSLAYTPAGTTTLPDLVALALAVLVLAIATAVFLSYKKAGRRGEKLWGVASKRLLIDMLVPLVTGGLLILILIANDLLGLAAPCTLIFYGLALCNAGRVTYGEVRMFGLLQIGLGLVSAYFIVYSLFLWAIGFGLLHILYGIYIHYRYER